MPWKDLFWPPSARPNWIWFLALLQRRTESIFSLVFERVNNLFYPTLHQRLQRKCKCFISIVAVLSFLQKIANKRCKKSLSLVTWKLLSLVKGTCFLHPYFVLLTQGQSSPLFWTMGSLYFWSYRWRIIDTSIVSLIKLKFDDSLFVDLLIWYKLWMLICFCFDLQIWQNNFSCTTCTNLVNQQRIGHWILA